MGVSHSLIKQPYNSIAYRILVMLLWTQYTVLNLVRAVIERLPYIGSLAEIFIPVCIIIAAMASLPWLLRHIRGVDVLLYVGIVLTVLLTMVIFPQNREYLEDEWCRILIFTASVYFIGVSFSARVCLTDLFWCSLVGVVSMLLYRLYQINSGATLENDDMDAAYKLLPSVMYLVYYASCKKRKIYWGVAISSAVVLFIFGTRGPIICVSIYLLVLVILKVLGSKHSVKTIFYILIFACFIAILFDEDLFIGIAGKAARIFDKIGFSTRIFDYFLAGNVLESRGREILLQQTIDAILANPIVGYGFTGDRYLLGIYTHNIVFEIWCHFGIVLGTFILIAIIALTVLALIKSWSHEKTFKFIVMLICMVFIKLMLSGSYVTETYFYFMIGVFVAVLRKGYTRRRVVIERDIQAD